MAYPPSRPERDPRPGAPTRDETPLYEAATLYAQSPHVHADRRERARRERRSQYGPRHVFLFGRAKRVAEPMYLVLAVLLLGLLWIVTRTSPASTTLSSPPPAATAYFSTTPPSMPSQKTFTLASRGKGCHLVQSEVEREISDMIRGVQVGILTLFIQHTSAALSLNENVDRDVRTDMDMALDHVVPESLPWRHTDEGPDDSVSHTKATLVGPSLTIPITRGQLNLGTWQGAYLCELRRAKHARRIVATVLP